MTDPREFNRLADLRSANIARQKEWDSGNQLTLAYRGNELAGEVGEACNVIKKLERERLGIAGSRDTVAHLAEELADVVICADLIAMHEGIDLLGQAVPAKFNATSEKVGLKTRYEPALRTAAAESGAGAGKVKPLEWRFKQSTSTDHDDTRANWPYPIKEWVAGDYSIKKQPREYGLYILSGLGPRREAFPKLEAAKAAAQADYEARIRSALIPEPAKAGDAVLLRKAFSNWLENKIALAETLRKNAYKSGNDRVGEKYHAVYCALLEIEKKFEALASTAQPDTAAEAKAVKFYNWTDEDYARARDCAFDILSSDGYGLDRSKFDNAFQHAVGMLALSAIAPDTAAQGGKQSDGGVALQPVLVPDPNSSSGQRVAYHPITPAAPVSVDEVVLADVAAERKRQREVEGWTPEHDDTHISGEMARAAICYADPLNEGRDYAPVKWPWSPGWWKPKDRRRDLVRAAALIVAEIERLDHRALLDAFKMERK